VKFALDSSNLNLPTFYIYIYSARLSRNLCYTCNAHNMHNAKYKWRTLDFWWFLSRLQDRCMAMPMSMRYPTWRPSCRQDRSQQVGTIRVGFTIKFPCRAPAAGCSTQQPIATQLPNKSSALHASAVPSFHDMHPLAQFVHAASYESIVFSHRPCTGLLVFITVKLNPANSEWTKNIILLQSTH
jgi:hypothetical protein